jgi:hypothetical protein
VGAPDDSDIFYDEIGNVAYPKYWHSSRSELSNFTANGKILTNIISTKAHNFDCPNKITGVSGGGDLNSGSTYYDGYFYLFAYGIPSFYCESSINVDLRQAFNNKEGDFWPHVSTGIPDDWLQESFVTIRQDNTYYYNRNGKQQSYNNPSKIPLNLLSAASTAAPAALVIKKNISGVTSGPINLKISPTENSQKNIRVIPQNRVKNLKRAFTIYNTAAKNSQSSENAEKAKQFLSSITTANNNIITEKSNIQTSETIKKTPEQNLRIKRSKALSSFKGRTLSS